MSELTAQQRANIKVRLEIGWTAEQLQPLMPGPAPEEKNKQAEAVFDCYVAEKNAYQCIDRVLAGKGSS